MGNHPAFLSMRADKHTPGSVVLITGATRGIGKEIALRYSRRGCSLVLAARGRDGLEETKADCEAQGAGACLTVSTDVTDEEACAHLVREAIREFGRLDVLVLNAGISAHFPFSEFADMQIFRRLFNVNFFGYGFFEALRMEYGDQIDVTICCPPSVNTGMRDGKAFAQAERLLEQMRSNTDSASSTEAPGSRQSGDPQLEDLTGPRRQFDEGKRDGSGTETTAVPPRHERTGVVDRRMPVEVCVDYIMKAADKRARKVMFPLYSYLAVYVRPFLPDIIDPLIKRAAKL